MFVYRPRIASCFSRVVRRPQVQMAATRRRLADVVEFGRGLYPRR